jgi:hypothetical protein
MRDKMDKHKRSSIGAMRGNMKESLAANWVKKYRPDVWILIEKEAVAAYPLIRKKAVLPVSLNVK